MPELPEVENYRKLLLPLIAKPSKLILERGCKEKAPPKTFITDDEIEAISGNVILTDIKRKGKMLCMVLKTAKPGQNIMKGRGEELYLFLLMGMTGRMATPENVPTLESLTSTDYPPAHTYMYFKTDNGEATFSDPRRFGGLKLGDTLEEGFGPLAPDALDTPIAEYTTLSSGLAGKNSPIKGLLLDQNRVVSGVGNWIADEVLYQTKIHPDQKKVSNDDATLILKTLRTILETAMSCLDKGEEYPHDGWIFHYRWGKQKDSPKDSKGQKIEFLRSGGRNSAIVPSIQKLYNDNKTKSNNDDNKKDDNDSDIQNESDIDVVDDNDSDSDDNNTKKSNKKKPTKNNNKNGKNGKGKVVAAKKNQTTKKATTNQKQKASVKKTKRTTRSSSRG